MATGGLLRPNRTRQAAFRHPLTAHLPATSVAENADGHRLPVPKCRYLAPLGTTATGLRCYRFAVALLETRW